MERGHRLARVSSMLAAFFSFAAEDTRGTVVTEVLRLLAVMLAPMVLAVGGLLLFLWHVLHRSPLE